MVKRSIHLLLAALAGLGSETAFAQSVRGRVSDDTGRALPGVSIQLRAPGPTQTAAQTVTDASGEYRIETGKGRYELRFSLVNFGEVMRRVTLSTIEETVIDAVLPLAFTASTPDGRCW